MVLLKCCADSERTRIGLATFDAQLQFWGLRPKQQASTQHIVGETAEPFCPLPASSLPALDPALRSLVGASLAIHLGCECAYNFFRLSLSG